MKHMVVSAYRQQWCETETPEGNAGKYTHITASVKDHFRVVTKTERHTSSVLPWEHAPSPGLTVSLSFRFKWLKGRKAAIGLRIPKLGNASAGETYGST
jgi:hypothetical protein